MKSYCGSTCDGMRQRSSQRGFSLAELLVAMSVGLVVLGALYGVFVQLSKQFANQEVVLEMQQNARVAMDIITRELRIAGYRPPHPTITLPRCSGSTTPVTTPCVGIVSAGLNSISFTSDLDGDGDLTADNTNPNENITYDGYTSSGIYSLGRTSNGTKQPVIGYLDSLAFAYYGANGAATNNLSAIRRIRVTIRVRASSVDPSNPAATIRTYTLESDVTPRNLAY